MSIQKIEIPENPSYQQLQELQYEVTKRMNVLLEIQINPVSKKSFPKFIFAGTNAKLNMPTLNGT